MVDLVPHYRARGFTPDSEAARAVRENKDWGCYLLVSELRVACAYKARRKLNEEPTPCGECLQCRAAAMLESMAEVVMELRGKAK